MSVRLQKYIADCGITSRRKAEELILQGRVKVNGALANVLGAKINPGEDVIHVDNQIIDSASVDKHYIILNKPRGYMTTLNDPEGRKTVLDLLKVFSERIYPVGRLDYLSEGLLLMTNDGDLANLVMHPRYEVVKVYEVKVFGAITEGILKKLRLGVEVDGEILKAKSVRVIGQLPNKTWLEFRLQEGKNREIRKICEGAGLTVDKLKRVAIGGLTIEGVSPGSFRVVSKSQLLKLIGLKADGTCDHEVEYFSPKKTINLRHKGVQASTRADDINFQKFRRENYFTTVKALKERKENEIKTKKEEAFREKEEAFQKRKLKKKVREEKKKNRPVKYAHAKFEM